MKDEGRTQVRRSFAQSLTGENLVKTRMQSASCYSTRMQSDSRSQPSEALGNRARTQP